MNVVALISGGKDSCFAALKARRAGHHVVALAHVKARRDEADSMMYQSVGSTAVGMLATAFGCPLIVHETNADAKCTSLHYAPVVGDEVEDLVFLLQKVKSTVPDVQAVCSGALWSDYQRLRVENAAYRSGLVSLAPLWRRSQPSLLDEMIEIGLDAVLIKVAGVGLNNTHLGKTLTEMRPTLLKLEQLYGSHVCGEGGEYETFVRWMPGFTKSLRFDHVNVIAHSDDPVAPVSYLRLEKVTLEQLTETQEKLNLEERDWSQKHPVDLSSLMNFSPKFYTSPADHTSICSKGSYEFDDSLSFGSKFSSIAVKSRAAGADGVKEVCKRLLEYLEQLSESIDSIVFVQLFLPITCGSFYADANRVYNDFFFGLGGKTVPGRACVGMGRHICGAALEALVRHGERSDARILHVQSVSNWAPPCIGPYCQFVEEDGIVHVSGVLPLHAPTVLVPTGMPASCQVKLCLDNMRRTLEAGRAKLDFLKFFVVYCSMQDASDEVSAAMQEYLPVGSIAVQVPVQTIPKEAIVEIRAVGPIEAQLSQSLEVAESFNDENFLSTVCGDLAFAIHEGREPLSISSPNCHRLIRDWNLLSAQIFYKEDQCDNDPNLLNGVKQTITKMKSITPAVAISTFSCKWFPSAQTHWIILGTYSRGSEAQ